MTEGNFAERQLALKVTELQRDLREKAAYDQANARLAEHVDARPVLRRALEDAMIAAKVAELQRDLHGKPAHDEANAALLGDARVSGGNITAARKQIERKRGGNRARGGGCRG